MGIDRRVEHPFGEKGNKFGARFLRIVDGNSEKSGILRTENQNDSNGCVGRMVNTIVKTTPAIHRTGSSALLLCCEVAGWDGKRNPSHALTTDVRCETCVGVGVGASRKYDGSVSSVHPN
jgi:hypothetical protein